ARDGVEGGIGSARSARVLLWRRRERVISPRGKSAFRPSLSATWQAADAGRNRTAPQIAPPPRPPNDATQPPRPRGVAAKEDGSQSVLSRDQHQKGQTCLPGRHRKAEDR